MNYKRKDGSQVVRPKETDAVSHAVKERIYIRRESVKGRQRERESKRSPF